MATEQLSTGSENNSEENPKPSFLKKVKAKAKKLKSKIKHNSSDDPHSTSADVANEDGSSGHHGYESSSDASSGDEAVHEVDGVPYTPLNNLVHNHRPGGVVTAESSEGGPDGIDPGNEYPTASNPAAYKNRGPADLQQAVPTTYHYFNDDPEIARLPSDYGGDAVPLSSSAENLPKEEASDSYPRSYDGIEVSKLDDESAIKSPGTSDIATGVQGLKTQGDDRLLRGSVEQDKGVGLPVAASLGLLNPAKSVGNNSGGGPDPKAAQHGGSVSLNATRDGEDVRKSTASPRKALTPANSLQGSEFPVADHSDTSFLEQVKEAVTNSNTVTDQEVDSSENVTATAGSGTATESASGKPIYHRAYEGLAAAAVGATGLAAAGGEKLGLYKSENGTSANAEHHHGSSTFPLTESAGKDDDSALKLGTGKNSDHQLREASTATPSSNAQNAGAPAEDHTWSQKAYNALFGAKANESGKLSPGSSDVSTNETNRSTISGSKVLQSEENGHSDPRRDGSLNSSVESRKYKENLKSADSTGKVLSSDMSDPGLAAQATTPDLHDKALANSITESISNLPSLLTSKLGFGGSGTNVTASPNGFKTELSDVDKSHVSSLNASPTASSANTGTGSETTAADEGPTAPGILDRMSGVASSLFGGGKKPVTGAAPDVPSSLLK